MDGIDYSFQMKRIHLIIFYVDERNILFIFFCTRNITSKYTYEKGGGGFHTINVFINLIIVITDATSTKYKYCISLVIPFCSFCSNFFSIYGSKSLVWCNSCRWESGRRYSHIVQIIKSRKSKKTWSFHIFPYKPIPKKYTE